MKYYTAESQTVFVSYIGQVRPILHRESEGAKVFTDTDTPLSGDLLYVKITKAQAKRILTFTRQRLNVFCVEQSVLRGQWVRRKGDLYYDEALQLIKACKDTPTTPERLYRIGVM